MQSQHPLKFMLPCLFAIIIDAMGFGLVYPVMTAIFMNAHDNILPLGTSNALRNFYLGLSFLLYPLCMFFGSSIMADLSDHFGRKKILSLCMLMIGVSFLLMGLGAAWSSLWLLMIGRGLSGLMAGSQPIAQAMIGDISTEDNKARNMGFVTFSYCAGLVVGPLLGGVLSDKGLVSFFSTAVPFYIACVLSFIACIWVFASLQDSFTPNPNHRISLTRPVELFVEAFQDKHIRFLSLIFLVMQIGWSLYFQYIVVHMRTAFHYNNWQMGTFNSMLGVGFAIGLLILLPRMSRVYKTFKLTLIGYLVTGVFIVVCALCPFPIPQWVLAIIIACYQILAFTGTLTLFSDHASADKQGWAMGVANAMIALSWTLTGLAANFLGLVSTTGLIAIGGVIYLFSALLLWIKSNDRSSVNE